jgi:hypothetical protein
MRGRACSGRHANVFVTSQYVGCNVALGEPSLLIPTMTPSFIADTMSTCSLATGSTGVTHPLNPPSFLPHLLACALPTLLLPLLQLG